VIVALPGDPRSDAWHVPLTKQSGDFVGMLQRAVKSTTKVRITYQSSHARQREARVVHPYAVIPARGTWYVVARCERTDAVKFFRVDRIASAELLDERFERPASLPVVELIRMGKPFQSGGSDSMVVRYSPRIARWIAEREGKSVDADGSITIEHPLADDTWAIRHVLQYGPEAEVLSPSRLRQQLKETLQAITH
jgi:predicted DNA-binding transcriptional regulator YafY